MLIQCIKFRKAQSTAEYAILFAIVIAAATAMQTYIRRSLNAKMKDSAYAVTRQSGTIGDATVNLAQTEQYEPYYTGRSVKTITDQDITTRDYTHGNQTDVGTVTRHSATDATVYEGYNGNNPALPAD